MDDSPLSIVSSVTGILTFIAAIVGFIYVRYNILRNGQDEMTTVFESVGATLEETRELMDRLAITEANSFRTDPVSRLTHELYIAEFNVILQYLRVFPDPGLEPVWRAGSLPTLCESRGPAWSDIMRKAEESGYHPPPEGASRRSCSQTLGRLLLSSIQTAWSGIMLVVNLGVDPRLMRWYMIRKEVMESMKRREILRSRIMFQLTLRAAV
jgi:hypothetical protein